MLHSAVDINATEDIGLLKSDFVPHPSHYATVSASSNAQSVVERSNNFVIDRMNTDAQSVSSKSSRKSASSRSSSISSEKFSKKRGVKQKY